MARPYDPGERIAAMTFDRFPEDVQDDEMFQQLFEGLFNKQNNWVEAHEWHDSLDAYLRFEYGIDLDDYFDWNDWRANYNAA